MKKHETWEQLKTTKAYIHHPLAGRIVCVYPDFKLTALELRDIPRHTDQKGCGLHFIFNGEDCDYAVTGWDTPEGGVPIYTMHSTDEATGCGLSMTAFCGDGRLPVTYCELRIENRTGSGKVCDAGVLPRISEQDHYLTGIFDTGYEPYHPNVRLWMLCRKPRFDCVTLPNGRLAMVSADGYMKTELLSAENAEVRWISRDEQKNRFEPNEYMSFKCDLPDGGNAVLRFAMTLDGSPEPMSYEDALRDALAFWQDIQQRVSVLPDTDDPKIIDIYRHSITQAMQMMQRYDNDKNPDFVYARQGDVGRYVWPYESSHYLTLLDRAGIFDHISDCYRMFFDNWQVKEGEQRGMINNPNVKWDNTNGIVLAGLCYHLIKTDDGRLFDSFKENIDMAVEYMQYRRRSPAPNEVPGLFTSGKASDWGEIGQHWTFTDAVNVRGLEIAVRCYEKFGADNAGGLRDIYEDYRGAIMRVLDGFSKEHHGEKAYNMPHILGVEFEECWHHCFYTDGVPYLVPLGILDPNSELFEQTENFYREIGMLDDIHGLAGRMTNDYASPGLYGNVYYTGVPEYCWITAWLARGERDKAAKYLAGLLRYNLSAEYIVSERYCSTDPFYAPWQPNGSGSGRMGHLLLDFYGERSK